VSRPIAKDHDEKRLHILKVAARVFAEHGFARASMSNVARECGISKANIYHYYASKDALLFDILDTYLSELRDRIRQLPVEGLDPADRLERIVSETLIAYEGMDHEHKIQIEGIALLAPEQKAILKAYQRDMVQEMSDVLADIAPSVFTEDPRKLRAAVMSVFGMINWFYMWNSSADKKAREDYAGLVTRLTLKGVHGL
jgi:AcrR family transcriptional regulator